MIWIARPSLETPFSFLYLELLKSCDNVFSKDADALKTIVMEETADYFGGSKTAEEVSKIIQRRTELYLMEIQ